MAQGKQIDTCIHGHKLTPDNIVPTKGRKRPRCRTCQRATNRRYSRRARRLKESVVKLPVEPFAKWLDGLVEQHGVEGACMITGMNQRQVWRITNRVSEGEGPPVAHIDTVDRATLNAEGADKLRELYPEIYADS